LYRIRPCGQRIRFVRSLTSESNPAVGHQIGGGFGIGGGQSVFAGMVVAGARRDDAQRNAGACELLQREGNHAVAAGGHHRVGAPVDGFANESTGMPGVCADDFDDIDATPLKLCDSAFGRVRRIAVT
jgi:hypothetical protein